MGETTTTTTTTRTTTTTTTVSINMSYLVPQGILKIIEVIVCIIVMALSDVHRKDTIGFVFLGYPGYYQGPTYSLAIAIIFFLTTLILLIFFVFNLVEKLGGPKIWFIIDTILNILAVVLFLIAFIVLCVYCSFTRGHVTLTFDKAIAALVFCLINVVLYILSVVFAVKAGQAPMISVKA